MIDFSINAKLHCRVFNVYIKHKQFEIRIIHNYYYDLLVAMIHFIIHTNMMRRVYEAYNAVMC